MVLSVLHNPMEMSAMRGLQKSANGLMVTLERLSTGKRINSAKDDPSGFIACELIRSDVAGMKGRLKSKQQLGSKLSLVDSGLAQISNLLNDAKRIIVASANTGALTKDQIQAYQMELDASIDSIHRITKMTSFQGEKVLESLEGLLNGTLTDEQRKEVVGVPKLDASGKLVDSAKAAKPGQETIGDLADSIAKSLKMATAVINKTATADSGGATEVIQSKAEAINPDSVLALQEIETPKSLAEIAAEMLAQQEAEELAKIQAEEAQKAAEEAEKEAKEREKAAKLEEMSARADKMYWLSRKNVSQNVELPQNQTEEQSERDLVREGIQSLFSNVKPQESVAQEGFNPTQNLLASMPILAINSETDAKEITQEFEQTLLSRSLEIAKEDETDDAETETKPEAEEPKKPQPQSIDDLKSGGVADLSTDTEAADKFIDEMIRSLYFARVKNGIAQRDVEIDNIMLTDSIYQNQQLDALISDADFAEEASNLARYELLMQMGMQALKIAQDYPKMVLNLLMQS